MLTPVFQPRAKVIVMKFPAVFVFALMLLFPPSCPGQIEFEADTSLAKEVKNKTLIVVMKEMGDKETKKKIKNGTYADAKKYMDEQNAHVDSIFRKFWVLNKNIVSKTESELEGIIKSKNNDYVYLDMERMTQQRTFELEGRIHEQSRPERRVCIFGYYIFSLKFTGSKNAFASVSSRGPLLNDIDYMNAMLILQDMVRIAEEGFKPGKMDEAVNQNSGGLKNKTLLLSQSLTKLSVNEIEEAYPFTFKISNDMEIIEKISSGDDQFVYAVACHKAGGLGTRFHYFIINCSDRKPVLFDEAGYAGFHTKKEITTWYESNALWQDSEGNYCSQLSPTASVITLGALKDFTKSINGK